MSKTILEGELSLGVKYKLIKNSKLPENAIVTAVIGIVLDDINNIFIARNERGWDLPGGHVEEGETTKEALIREVEEEAGTRIADEIALWGYKKMNSDSPISNGRGGFYPKESYIAFYRTKSQGEQFPPHGEEIIEAKKLKINDALLLLQNKVDKLVIGDVKSSL